MIRVGLKPKPVVSPNYKAGASGERGWRGVLAGSGAGGGRGQVSHSKT